MDTHEGTGILPKAACSRYPTLAPSRFQRDVLVPHLPPVYTHGAPSTVYDSSADGGTSISPLAM